MKSPQIVDLVFGVSMAALAVAILVLAEPTNLVGSIAAALVIGGLGVEAVVSAFRGKRSLLARVGPLP